jgi:2-polyprenyl-3-methyl-5-hydroxy-6-metoxy-1,4-benzoquinol methylase
MDQPGLDNESHHAALAGLRTTNSLSRVPHVIWRGLVDADLLSSNGQPLRILDIAAGGGDVVIGVAKLAARMSVTADVHGCDINPAAVRYAQSAANRAGVTAAQFFQLNALTDRLPDDYDVVMCTLFLHHLSEIDACELLSRMANSARRGVLVDDLQRSRLGYFYAWAGARLLTRSHIVHVDGPLSVRSAYTVAEVRRLAQSAGLVSARFRCHWPQRFLMSWRAT